MPDDKQIEVLMKGVKTWNTWRRDNPGIPIDLSCAMLDGAHLPQVNLANCDLTHAFLHDANLCGARLSGARLIGTNFCRAQLCGADLKGADLHRANFDRADLTGANLSGANLERAMLVRTKVAGAEVYALPGIWGLRVGPRPEKRKKPVEPPHYAKGSTRANHGRQSRGRSIRLLAATQ